MIRRRTSEAGGGVLSFTFLDVLTCTMGSLVLLLVVLAQKATDVTLEEALADANKPRAATEAPKETTHSTPDESKQPEQLDEKTAAAIADLEKAVGDDAEGKAKLKLDENLKEVQAGLTPEELAERLAEVREARQKIEKMRADAAQRMKDDQAKVGHLEEHERRLEQEIAKLQLALKSLEEAESKQSVDQDAAKSQLERLKEVIADAEKQIDELRKETVGKKSYSIVPYKGANGTTRRPIYIECTKDAVTIYPEGIRLSAADFDGPLRSGNPLSAAIRAAREELNARAAAAGQTDLPDPYPLLIVRPDGTYAYSAALSAISSWDADFGYEFVEADWKLEYPDTDPRLEQLMRHAVEQARQRQAMLAKAAPRRYGPRLSLGSGEGGGGGGGDGEGGAGFEGVSRPGGDGDRIGDHSGENWIAGSAGGNAAGVDGGAGMGTGSTAGRGVQSGATGGNRYAGEGLTAGPGGAGGAADGNFADASTSPGATAGGTTGSGQAAGGAEQGGQPGGQTAANGGQPGQGGVGGTEATGSTQQPGGSTMAGSNTPSGAASSQTTSTGASSGAQGSATGGASAGQAGGASGSATGGTSSGGMISYTAGQTASAAQSRGANWANEAATRRASAISRPIRVVVNPEQIDVMPTNQGGSGPVGPPTAITFHQPTDKVLDQLAAAVKERMNDWGLAGHNMYWRPTLVLQVAPGAEQHAIRLNDLLRDSGIDVKFQEVASRTEEGAGNGTTR